MTMIPSPRKSYSTLGQSSAVPLTEDDVSTGDVVSAYSREAFSGVGTLNADFNAERAESFQVTGKPITEEEYKASPFFRRNIAYNDGMTLESAKVLAEFDDERKKSGAIISRASNFQAGLGIASAFAFGVLEPKNIGYGIAGAIALSPVAAAVPIAGTLRRISQMRKAAQIAGVSARIGAADYAALAGYGAVEGMVSAAIMEPSNRDSASILLQDYTMSDSLWNIGTSAVFGAVLHTAPTFIRDKWDKYRARTPEILTRELDVATDQLSSGRKVDVGFVEQTLKTQDVFTHEKAAAMLEATPKENIYADVDSKILRMTAEQQNLRLQSLDKKMEAAIIKPKEMYEREALNVVAKKEIDNSQSAAIPPSQWKDGLSPQILDSLNNPASYVIKEKATGKVVMETFSRDVASKINTNKYEAVPVLEHLANQNGQSYIKSSGDSPSPKTINKAIIDSAKPENDMAIDSTASRTLDELDTELESDGKTVADDYKKLLSEIAFMKKEGLMTDSEIEMFTDAINAVNEKDLQSGYDALLTCLTRG